MDGGEFILRVSSLSSRIKSTKSCSFYINPSDLHAGRLQELLLQMFHEDSMSGHGHNLHFLFQFIHCSANPRSTLHHCKQNIHKHLLLTCFPLAPLRRTVDLHSLQDCSLLFPCKTLPHSPLGLPIAGSACLGLSLFTCSLGLRSEVNSETALCFLASSPLAGFL